MTMHDRLIMPATSESCSRPSLKMVLRWEVTSDGLWRSEWLCSAVNVAAIDEDFPAATSNGFMATTLGWV